MTNPKTIAEPQGECELLVTREFAAPRELVFRTWTEREHLMNWWGPRTWPLDYCTVDLRVGGAWHYRMRGPNGEEAWGKGIYKEIARPERLAYDDYFSDADGSENPPAMFLAVDFEDRGGKTLLRSKATFASREHREQVLAMGMVEGLSESLDRLDEHIEAAVASAAGGAA